MLRALSALFLVSTAVAAQERPFLEAATDEVAYASGEPITVTVSITNPTPEALQYWFPSGCLINFVLDGETYPAACTLAYVPVVIGSGMRWEQDATIYPDSSGFPVTGGTHTLLVEPQATSVVAPGSPPGGYPEVFRLADATVTFDAPAADAGVVYVAFSEATDSAAVKAVRRDLNADVLSSRVFMGEWRETWQVSGAPLATIVNTYGEDDLFTRFAIAEDYRWMRFSAFRFATSGEASPESPLALHALGSPCSAACAVTLDGPATPEARLAVFDPIGREVAVLHDGPLAPGERRWALPTWLRSGLYVVRATTPVAVEAVPVVVVR